MSDEAPGRGTGPVHGTAPPRTPSTHGAESAPPPVLLDIHRRADVGPVLTIDFDGQSFEVAVSDRQLLALARKILSGLD